MIYVIQRWNLSNVLHKQDSHFFINFSREKRSNRDIFGQKLRIEDVLLTYFEQYVSFLCNNQLKYTERMIFALNP